MDYMLCNFAARLHVHVHSPPPSVASEFITELTSISIFISNLTLSVFDSLCFTRVGCSLSKEKSVNKCQSSDHSWRDHVTSPVPTAKKPKANRMVQAYL